MKLVTKIAFPLVVMALAACGSASQVVVNTSAPGTTTGPGSTTGPGPTTTLASSSTTTPGADHGGVVVRLGASGGFVPPDFIFRTMPYLVVYADGLVITQGPQIAIYPGPALPNLIARQLDAAGLAAVKEAITSAGLVTATPPDYDQEPMQIADAPTTTLTVTFDGITARHSAYALSMGQTPETGARKTLADVVERLDDLAVLVGAEHIGPEKAFAPTRFAIRASASEADPSSPVVDWPFASVLLSAATDCLVVDDPAAPAIVRVDDDRDFWFDRTGWCIRSPLGPRCRAMPAVRPRADRERSVRWLCDPDQDRPGAAQHARR